MKSRYKKLIPISIILIGLASIGYRKILKTKTKNFFKELDKNYYSGDYELTENKLKKYTKENPQEPNGWGYLGSVYLKMHKDSLAQLAFAKTLKFRPTAKVYTLQGVAYMRQMKYILAIESFREAISIDKAYQKAYSNLLLANIRIKNYSKATYFGEQALKLDGKNNIIKGNLLVAYHMKNDSNKRNKLLRELEKIEYQPLENIKLLIEGNISIDELLGVYTLSSNF